MCYRRAVAVPAAFLLLSACDRLGPAGGMPQPAPPDPQRIERPERWTPDVARLDLEKQIPGFGGHYFDAEGNMHVVLTDTSQIEVARTVLEKQFRETPPGYTQRPGTVRTAEPRIVADQGRYTFSQLYTWKRLARRVGVGNGVVGIGIGMKANKVTIGVDGSSDVERVLDLLIRAGIPRDAIEIQTGKLGTAGASLSSYRDTLEGGLRIEIFSNALNYVTGYCSQGFNARHDFVRVFVTASHCTAQRGGTNGSTFYQPSYAEGRVIGTEYYDPPWRTSLEGGDCYELWQANDSFPLYPYNGQQYRCRESDAALVLYDNSYGVGETGTFTIAHTDGWQSTTIDPVLSHWYVTDTEMWPIEGTLIYKVGQTTGFTWGQVERECWDTQQKSIAGDALPFIVLCQVTVDAPMGFGDSGAPAFLIPQAFSSDVTLAGVLNTYFPDGTYAFSTLYAVFSELGLMTVY